MDQTRQGLWLPVHDMQRLAERASQERAEFLRHSLAALGAGLRHALHRRLVRAQPPSMAGRQLEATAIRVMKRWGQLFG